LHTGDEAAGEGALIGQEHGGREAPGIVIDGESEQRELEEGYPDHHRKGQTIPSHLHQLLGDDAPETPQRSG